MCPGRSFGGTSGLLLSLASMPEMGAPSSWLRAPRAEPRLPREAPTTRRRPQHCCQPLRSGWLDPARVLKFRVPRAAMFFKRGLPIEVLENHLSIPIPLFIDEKLEAQRSTLKLVPKSPTISGSQAWEGG